METDDDGKAPVRGTPATWALVIMNVVVAASMASLGVSPVLASIDALTAVGALSSREAWSGEVWRLFTALFVHGGLWHIGLNMWVLAQVGRALEVALGASRFVLVYLASGVFGFALSLLVHPGVTAGASGAVFGVAGGLFGIALHTRGLAIGRAIVAPLIPFVVGTLALGFLIPFVDNSAHVGGLIMGVLLGFALSTDVRFVGVDVGPARAALDRKLGTASLVVALALFVVVVPISLRPTFSPTYAVTMGLAALARGDDAAVREHLARATALAPQDGSVLAFTARTRAEPSGERTVAARRTARAAATPFFREALRAFDAERPDLALAHAMAALGRGPDPRLFVIVDEEMTRGLCEAAVAASEAAAIAEVWNNCAWFFVNVRSPEPGDLDRAHALAERAVALLLGERDPASLSDLERDSAAAYLHTLAETRLALGDAEEARATLERIVAQGFSDDAFYVVELDRVRRAASRARKDAAREAVPTLERDGGAGDGGAPLDAPLVEK